MFVPAEGDHEHHFTKVIEMDRSRERVLMVTECACGAHAVSDPVSSLKSAARSGDYLRLAAWYRARGNDEAAAECEESARQGWQTALQSYGHVTVDDLAEAKDWFVECAAPDCVNPVLGGGEYCMRCEGKRKTAATVKAMTDHLLERCSCKKASWPCSVAETDEAKRLVEAVMQARQDLGCTVVAS